MEGFDRNRYKFSTAPSLVEVGGEVEKVRKEQVSLLEKDLYLYKVLIKDLYIFKPEYKDRNLILNLAKFIISDIELLDEFHQRRELPSKMLVKKTKIQRAFIERWYDYIVSYTVIFSNPNYNLIQNYFKIETNEEENNVTSLDTFRNENNKEYKGIIIKKYKRCMCILTSTGEYIKVKNVSEYDSGQEFIGEEKKGLKDYKIHIAIGVVILIVLIGGFLSQYHKIDTTVVVKTTSQIKIDINPFGKVIYIYSATDKGEELVNSIKAKNSTLDGTLKDVLEYSKENNMIPEGNILITVTGKPIKYGSLQKTGEYILANKMNIVINNAGNEHKLYESIKKELEDKAEEENSK